MLRPVGRDLWIADGPPVTFLGVFAYPTRMAVVRLRDGSLWIWSPIALDPELGRAVDALGPVRHLVSPNKLHHLFLADWAAVYAEAQVWGSPGLARRRPDLALHGELGDQPEAAWADDLDQVVVRGSPVLEEVVFFHRASSTALVTDLVQRFPPESLVGWRRWLMRLDGLVGERGSTPREWRASFLNRRRARAARDHMLAWKPTNLVIAHGTCAIGDGADVLERALGWMG